VVKICGGSAHIQSLADLSNSFEMVRTMRIAPFTKDAVVQPAALTLAPVEGERVLGISGLISILMGLILMLRPEAGILSVARLIGIFSIALGILLTLLGLKFQGMRSH